MMVYVKVFRICVAIVTSSSRKEDKEKRLSQKKFVVATGLRTQQSTLTYAIQLDRHGAPRYIMFLVRQRKIVFIV